MNQFIKAVAFLQHLFDQERLAEQAGRIIEAILAARSPRLSDIAEHMPGSVSANYKAIQRFLQRVDLKALLLRLLPVDAPYVIGDPTEIARPQAYKTDYISKLKDRKTSGFWLLLLATPYRGRALPCGFVTYSSKTISHMQRSRNQYHWEAFEPLKGLLGSPPLVLDREFSYLELLEYCQHAHLNFVIRVHLRSHQPTFLDGAGRKITFTVALDQQVEYRQLLYLGKVPVNVVGVWRKGHARPLWIMSTLPPAQALAIYTERMKIEESFRDHKSLLNLDKLMNMSQARLRRLRLRRPTSQITLTTILPVRLSSTRAYFCCSNANWPYRPNSGAAHMSERLPSSLNSCCQHLSELKSGLQFQRLTKAVRWGTIATFWLRLACRD